MVRLFMMVGFALAASVTIVTWLFLSQEQHRKTGELLALEAANARDLIAHDLQVRLDAIERLGERMSAAQYINERQFSMDAEALLHDMPGFFAIAWIGTDNRVALAEPDRTKRLIGTNLKSLGPQRVTLAEHARITNGITIGERLDLVNDGGTGFIVAKAVRRGGQHIGTLWVVLQVSDWVDDLYAGANGKTLEKLDLAMFIDGKPIFTYDMRILSNAFYTKASDVPVADTMFTVAVSPRDGFVSATDASLRQIVTALIGTLSGALLFAGYALRASRVQQKIASDANRDLQDVNAQLEEEVKQRGIAEEMARQSNVAKSQFMSTMSHEMRTPMNGIMGMAELLGQSRMTPEQSAQVAKIRKCAADLMENVSDILDFARFESGKVRLKQEACDVRKITMDSVQILRHFAQKKGLALTCEVDPNLPENCCMDRGRYRQILLNLMRNGIKFTQEGTVHVSLRKVAQDGTDQLELRVIDTGVGIASEKRDVIFGAFQQADGALDRQFEGSGLGLSIVERVTTTMGGTVELRSELGKGSEFIIHLPLETICPSVAASQTEKAAPHALLDGANVLLAEDNLVNQKIVQGFIKGSGVNLDIAADGEEATHLYEQGRYDAVLMDVSMPNRNGFDATRAIRALEKSRAMHPCPIIAYTANCGENDQRQCYDAGMDDVLPKPASKQELANRLAFWVSKNPVADKSAVAS